MENNSEVLKRAKAFIASLPLELYGQARKPSFNGQFTDDVLPFDLYKHTRQNIERISDQINKSFFFEIYDGCAVLMRKLIEMLLILSFKEQNIDSEIRGGDNKYINLSEIIKKASASIKLDLSPSTKESLDIFREKGNMSAHNHFHNACRKDIEMVQLKFRNIIEELFYKAGIIK